MSDFGTPQPPVPPQQPNPQQPTLHQPTAPIPVLPPPPKRAPRARLSSGSVALISALAMVIGLLGGILGATTVNWLSDDDSTPTSSVVTDGANPADPSTPDPSVQPISGKPMSVTNVAKALLPSTVQIIAEYDGQAQGATGSGFVYDNQGHIITNNHVVAAAAADDGPIEVVDNEGNHYDASLVGRSEVYDIAVLKVDAKLVPAALGASKALSVGDPVVAFGSPLGLTQTVTSGIVSALHRPVTTGDSADSSSYIDAVQTDAAINPGNSGGPLVNMRGQVVGINSAIATSGGSTGEAGNIGVGFAIAIEQVRSTVSQILAKGEAEYPVIGASVRTSDDADVYGASVEEVADGDPAQRAGLEAGDIITKVNGQVVTDSVSLIVAIRSHRPGDTVTVTYVRDGNTHETPIVLAGKVG